MGVYHITYTPGLKEICLFFNGRCNFSCRGCIRKYLPEDCHLNEIGKRRKNRVLSREGVISFLTPLSFKKVIFLGLEPTVDCDFLPLARRIKELFSTYNILITNGYKYIGSRAIDEVCVSIKAVSKKIFKDFTGRGNPERILRNFKRYAGTSGLKVRAESVFIPNYIDRGEIEKIAKFIAGVDSSISYRIDGYIPGTDDYRRPTRDEMNDAKTVARRYLKNVSILHHGTKLKHRVQRIY